MSAHRMAQPVWASNCMNCYLVNATASSEILFFTIRESTVTVLHIRRASRDARRIVMRTSSKPSKRVSLRCERRSFLNHTYSAAQRHAHNFLVVSRKHAFVRKPRVAPHHIAAEGDAGRLQDFRAINTSNFSGDIFAITNSPNSLKRKNRSPVFHDEGRAAALFFFPDTGSKVAQTRLPVFTSTAIKSPG